MVKRYTEKELQIVKNINNTLNRGCFNKDYYKITDIEYEYNDVYYLNDDRETCNKEYYDKYGGYIKHHSGHIYESSIYDNEHVRDLFEKINNKVLLIVKEETEKKKQELIQWRDSLGVES